MTEGQERGLLESGQHLVQLGKRQWRQQNLLAAAERGELRNTGWPIGLVIRKPGVAPVPTLNGIEARLSSHNSNIPEDFWFFRNDGSYYVSRFFEEDIEATPFASSHGHPQRPLWFDVRIWRIAEVILHSASLYRELGIPPDEPYVLAVNHHGLAGRELYTSNPRRFVSPGRFCQSPATTWTREVTQDYVTANLKTLAGEVSAGLFVLFDFAEVDQRVIDQIVDEFLGHRV
ncbi:MAG: hypothetical protein HY532_06415 [Chloroflexi bacterium]|nr:hypothetical protein [Chloroflexota bacterium]